MRIIIPISSFLLAVTAYCLKNIQMGIDTTLMQLYSIDAVNKSLRLKIMTLSDEMFYWVILIALIAVAIAGISLYIKLCNKMAGILLLLISVLSFLFSLIRV